MKRVIAFLFVGLFFLGGCQSINQGINELEDEVVSAEKKIKEKVKRYKEFQQQYVKKKKFVVKLIDTYKGETWDASMEETGIQDVIYENIQKNPGNYTEEEITFLYEADAKVYKFVSFLKEADAKIQELDQMIKNGIKDVEQFIAKFKEVMNKSRKVNKALQTTSNILLTSLKLGAKFVDK